MASSHIPRHGGAARTIGDTIVIPMSYAPTNDCGVEGGRHHGVIVEEVQALDEVGISEALDGDTEVVGDLPDDPAAHDPGLATFLGPEDLRGDIIEAVADQPASHKGVGVHMSAHQSNGEKSKFAAPSSLPLHPPQPTPTLALPEMLFGRAGCSGYKIPGRVVLDTGFLEECSGYRIPRNSLVQQRQ